MPDVFTLIADVVVPEVFAPYVIERTAELSELVQSGIVDTDEEFSRRITTAGGDQIKMPFWQDLAGDDAIVTEAADIEVAAISTAQDLARRQIRAKAWGAHDLAGILAGDKPMDAIATLLADYRQRRLQAQVISTLQGVFASASMSGNLNDIHQPSGATDSSHYLTGKTFIDSTQLMGDAKTKLAAVVMHSAVEASLRKLDLIDFIPDSQGAAMLPTFQGKRVIVDDGCPVETIDSKPVYSTYIFGQGAIALGWDRKNDPIDGGFGTFQLEFGRDAKGSKSFLINRWSNLIHPRGVAWTENTVAAEFPTNAELETGANWNRVYEQKNVRIVKVRHNIPA